MRIGHGEFGKLAGVIGLVHRPCERAHRFIGALLADIAKGSERITRPPHGLVDGWSTAGRYRRLCRCTYRHLLLLPSAPSPVRACPRGECRRPVPAFLWR